MFSASLERKYRREFRSHVVTRVAGNAAKQRQPTEVQRGPIGCAGTVVSLFESKCHPRVQFVLNVSRKEIALATNGGKSSRILRQRLVKTVIEIGSPSGITAFRISLSQTRKRKTQLHKASSSANRSLRCDARYSIQESKDHSGCAVDCCNASRRSQSGSVTKIREQLTAKEESQV